MTEHEPSPEYAKALDDFAATKEAHEAAKQALRDATAAELKTTGATTKQLAATSPWSEETLRGIAREYGVERKRKPTVKSIKPQKRTAGG